MDSTGVLMVVRVVVRAEMGSPQLKTVALVDEA
jgi:hypothetical protein